MRSSATIIKLVERRRRNEPPYPPPPERESRRNSDDSTSANSLASAFSNRNMEKFPLEKLTRRPRCSVSSNSSNWLIASTSREATVNRPSPAMMTIGGSVVCSGVASGVESSGFASTFAFAVGGIGSFTAGSG